LNELKSCSLQILLPIKYYLSNHQT